MSKKQNVFMWTVFTLCVFLKLFPLTFHYRPLQDDYIQYHVYSLFKNSFTDFIIPNGILSSRPLAGIFDFFVWSAFWQNMTVALWIISALHIASAIMLKRIFNAMNIQLCPAFFVVYLLLPISFEATYWISASSRIVVSTFFGVSAAYLSVLYLKHDKAYLKPVIFILFLSSLLFYEQTAVVNSALFLFVLLQHKKVGKRLVLPFISAIVVTATYYILFTFSSNRIPTNPDSLTLFIKRFGVCVYNLFTHDSFGFFNEGLRLLSEYLSSGNLLHISVCVLSISASILLGISVVKQHTKNSIKTDLMLIILGVLIVVLSFTPYIMIRFSYLPYRAAFAAVIGFAFISAGILDMLPIHKSVKAGLISLFTIICIFGNIYQADTMKQVAEKDAELIEDIAGLVIQSSVKDLEIYGYQPLYIKLPDFYKSRVYNITSSDWAISGAVRSYLNDTEINIHLVDNNF